MYCIDLFAFACKYLFDGLECCWSNVGNVEVDAEQTGQSYASMKLFIRSSVVAVSGYFLCGSEVKLADHLHYNTNNTNYALIIFLHKEDTICTFVKSITALIKTTVQVQQKHFLYWT